MSESLENVHKNEIIKTLLYFDIFNYPLKENEIYENLSINYDYQDFKAYLNLLIEEEVLICKDGFFLVPTSEFSNIERRVKGNKGAAIMLPEAYKYSKKIAALPFIEGVCLSGGISKNYYDKESDIDFFIITSKNRLWVSKVLTKIFYNLQPVKRRKQYCMNYFVSENNLEIPDHNHFVATELAHLIPTVNYDIYNNILKKNIWYKTFLPNKKEFDLENCQKKQSGILKKFIESVLAGKLGDIIDNYLFNWGLKRIKMRFPKPTEEDFELKFRTKKDVCKRHEKGHQNKILDLWDKKLQEFEKNYNPSILK